MITQHAQNKKMDYSKMVFIPSANDISGFQSGSESPRFHGSITSANHKCFFTAEKRSITHRTAGNTSANN